MEVILYTTHCPQCRMLEKRLEDSGIQYTEKTDIQEMIDKGFTNVPVLVVDGKAMQVREAVAWVDEQ